MKRFFRILPVLSALLLAGCNMEDELLITNHYMMGTIVDGRILSDEGIWYNVVEQTCEGDIFAETRAFIVCDIVKNRCTSKENAYDIRLKRFNTATVMQHEKGSTEGKDREPVCVDFVWASGIYLNFHVQYWTVSGSDSAHEFSAVIEELPHDTYPIVVNLCHNAGGVYPGAEGYEETKFEITDAYLSIPLTNYYENGKVYSYYYTVKYPWYKTDDNGKLTYEITEQEVSGKMY